MRVKTFNITLPLLVALCLTTPDGILKAGEADSTFVNAVLRYEEGDYRGSLLLLEPSSRRDSTDDAVLFYKGLCNFALGYPEAAIADFNRAVKLDSANIWYRETLARAYLQRGDENSAARHYRYLVDKQPGLFGNPYTFTIVGDYFKDCGRDSTALSYYRNALIQDPGYLPAMFSKSEALFAQQNRPAFVASVSDIMSSPDVEPEIKVEYMKALVSSIDGRFYFLWRDSIHSLLDKCIETTDGNSSARLLRAEINYAETDTTAALRECEYIVANPASDTLDRLSAYQILGDTAYLRSERKKAYSYYDKALKIKADYVPILNNYAYFLCLEGRKLKKALKMSEITIIAEPDNPTYLDTYGWILHLTGRDEEAKAVFKRVVVLGGKKSPEVLQHYAEVLEALGEKDLAKSYRLLSQQAR